MPEMLQEQLFRFLEPFFSYINGHCLTLWIVDPALIVESSHRFPIESLPCPGGEVLLWFVCEEIEEGQSHFINFVMIVFHSIISLSNG